MKKTLSLIVMSALFSSILLTGCAEKATSEFGIFSKHADIGECALPGNFMLHPESGCYSIIGSGENMWFGSDQLQFAWMETDDDFIMRARLEFIGEGKNAHRKIGIMIRNSADTSSAHVSAVVHGDGLTALQYRGSYAADTEEVISDFSGPDAIQLERKGNEYVFTAAFENEVVSTMELSKDVFDPGTLVGLFMCSHDNTVAEKAVFHHLEMLDAGKNKQESFESYLERTTME